MKERIKNIVGEIQIYTFCAVFFIPFMFWTPAKWAMDEVDRLYKSGKG